MTQPASNQSLEQRSQPSEFHIGTVIDAIPGFMWSALPNGDLEFCSQGWLDYTGMSLEKVRGKEFATLINPQEKADFVDGRAEQLV